MKYQATEDSQVRVYKHLPKGWNVVEGSWSQPEGTVWINNGKSRFRKSKAKKDLKAQNGRMLKNPKYKNALLIVDEELMLDKISKKRIAGKNDRFVTDKTWESKIQTSVRKEKKREREERAIAKRLLGNGSAAKKKPVAKAPKAQRAAKKARKK